MTFREFFENCSVLQEIKVGYENDLDEFVTLAQGSTAQDFVGFFDAEVELIYAGKGEIIYVEIEGDFE